AWKLEPGDLVFNRTNSKELVGKCEVFKFEGDWIFASYLMRLRINAHEVLPVFLRDFLSGPTGRWQIDRDSRQIVGMSNINAEEIRRLVFPKPDRDTQARLVRQMEAARDVRRQQLAQADAVLGSLAGFVLELPRLTLP